MDIVLRNPLETLYFGVVITMALWGIGVLQAYHYFNRYIKDTLWIKLFVLLVWISDTVHQALVLHMGFVYLVVNHDNPISVLHIETTLEVSVAFTVCVVILVQLFLLFRIWKLSGRNIYLTTVVAVFVSMVFIFTTLFLYKNFQLKAFIKLKSIAWLIKLCYAVISATDTLIAVTLIILLHRSRTGFVTSDSMINRLILFTVNTGALSSLLSLFIIIMLQVYPNSLIFVAFHLCTSKFYTNTLLATLNTRGTTEAVTDEQLSASRKSSNIRRQNKLSRNNSITLAIQVETVTSRKTDDIGIIELRSDNSETKVDADTLDLELGST